MTLVERIEQKSFLGTEFATWLWFQSETERGTINLGKAEKNPQLEFEKDLVLTSDFGEATASTLKGDMPTMAPEAVAALVAGKKVKRAKIRITHDNATFLFTLNAENFDWGSLKVEVPPSLPFEEAVPIRLKALDQFHALFQTLFSHFLDIRLDASRWKKVEKSMRDWVGRKATAEEDEPGEES